MMRYFDAYAATAHGVVTRARDADDVIVMPPYMRAAAAELFIVDE